MLTTSKMFTFGTENHLFEVKIFHNISPKGCHLATLLNVDLHKKCLLGIVNFSMAFLIKC